MGTTSTDLTNLDLECALRTLAELWREGGQDLESLSSRQRETAERVAAAVDQDTIRVLVPAGVRRFLDLSTAHLPVKLREFRTLNQYAAVVAYERNDGEYSRYQPMTLWVPDDPRGWAEEYDEDDQPPAEVLALQLYAREQGCDYIMIDRDAGTLPGLPTWDD